MSIERDRVLPEKILCVTLVTYFEQSQGKIDIVCNEIEVVVLRYGFLQDLANT